MASSFKIVDDFQFPAEFGFTESAHRNDAPRAKADRPMEENDGTYVGRQAAKHGGRVRKADGGRVQQETLAAPNQSFGQAFHAARQVMLAGGPKTFNWNGRSYSTDLATGSPQASTGRAHASTPMASTGRAHMTAEDVDAEGAPLESTGRAHMTAAARDSEYSQAAPPKPAPGDFSSWSARQRAAEYARQHPGAYNQPADDQAAEMATAADARERAARAAERAPDYESAQANSSFNQDTPGTTNRYAEGVGDGGGGGGYARGGRVHRAVGGSMGMPGPAPASPMDRATVTMPMTDARRVATGVMNVGKAVGARQAVDKLAQAARVRQAAQAGPPGASTALGATPQPMRGPGVPGEAGLKRGGHLTAAQRHNLPRGDFALSGERYPINDASHARNALARVAQHGSPSEQSTVRAAVHRKYPGIGKK
jgi:hypothetical protein